MYFILHYLLQPSKYQIKLQLILEPAASLRNRVCHPNILLFMPWMTNKVPASFAANKKINDINLIVNRCAQEFAVIKNSTY